ncbi:PDZ domain-containing protein [Natrarchaeobius halalkaliphilus]|uniref:PDZ domain-containing protein n=1 Tax=Natrarchaeobius halalkaliphilus TaxID=1679091 RepID=A0A3N6LJU9_9EURY|nr:trypsin-like peptidase domain-containing protein [Natrarchaeobius halalkaliphilus]RQG86204.1 PDZ domain-containing protein [Natrarchaeobius halalkaliphilus]
MPSRQRPCSRRRMLALALGTSGLIGGTTVTGATRSVSSSEIGGGETNGSIQNDDVDSDGYAAVYEETIDDVVLVAIRGSNDDPGGLGSGFVLENGFVVTNHHVAGDADGVEVQFRDEQWRTGTVVGSDRHSDLAVVEIDDLPEIVSGLSLWEAEPVIGSEVLALGNPLGLDASISQGIVSGIDRSLPSPTGFSIPAAIQTDAPVNPGNSGGPLVTLEGEVLGVVFAGLGQTIGFAISALLADRVVPALIGDGAYDHPYLGVGVLPVGPQVATANDLEEPRGVLITDVEPGGPADGVLESATERETIDGDSVRAGGDVIVAIDGHDIPNEEILSSTLALETSPGETIEIDVVRDGERGTLEVTLSSRPDVDTP